MLEHLNGISPEEVNTNTGKLQLLQKWPRRTSCLTLLNLPQFKVIM